MISINSSASRLAIRNLSTTQQAMQKSVERLSSGLRVGSSKDDAAGLAISTRMESNIRGSTVALRNVSDGISYLQTYEGGLQSVLGNLQRMRELSVQAKNGTLNSSDRGNLNSEFKALLDENSRITSSSQFNGKSLYDQTSESMELDLQISESSTDSIKLNLSKISDLRYPDGSVITGVPVSLSSGINLLKSDFSQVDILSVENAETSLDEIDRAIDFSVLMASQVGAYQSRLESIASSIEVSIETSSTARGRIIDADFAKETATLTRNQIIQQAALAMTIQANASPKLALQLLET